jgi:hypothetical protein
MRANVNVDGEYGNPEWGQIEITDADGEIVMWDVAEWTEDPSLVFVIVRAAREALLEGGAGIRRRLAEGAR